MAEQVAWVGLGNMGRGMVRNIIDKYPLQTPLIVYNRTLDRTKAFAATLPNDKTTVATSLDAVAKADIILTCVANDAAIRATIDSILSFNPAPTLFIDCSTIHPSTSTALGALLTAAGHSFVAMPVFGTAAVAASGQLVCVPAGPSASVQRALPFTTAVGRCVIDLSDKPYGTATLLKAVGNSFILNMVEMLAEGHVLAEKSGLGSDILHQFVEAVMPGVYAGYSGRMVSGDYYMREEPLFGVALARKDARHALELARDAGTRLESMETVEKHLEKVEERMGGRGDLPGIFGVVREEAGLPFGNRDEKK